MAQRIVRSAAEGVTDAQELVAVALEEVTRVHLHL